MAIVAVLQAALAWAQPVQVPRKVLLYFEASAGANLARGDLIYLYETLLSRLQRAALVTLEPGDVTVPQSNEDRSLRAAERGADAWVRVVAWRSGEDLRFEVIGVDLTTDRALVLQQSFRRVGLEGAERIYWDEVVEVIASIFPPVEQKLEGAFTSADEVTVKALEGTIVTGLGKGPLAIGPDGTGRVTVTLPGFYRIEATREGSLAVREERYLAAGETTIEIVQRPAPRWLFEGYTLNASYLGGSAGEVFGPFYFRLGLTTYLIAPWLRNEQDEATDASRPLTEFLAGFGYMPIGWEAPVRPYLDVSALARIMHAGGTVALEPVAPFGYRAAVGVEVRGSTRFRAFADYGPVFYDVHDSDPAAVEATITVDGQRSSGYFYKPWWGGLFDGMMVDLIAFRLGLRWYR